MDENEDKLKNFKETLKENTLKSVKNIQKAIENNKLVIFVGAGVSKNSGIPTWNELIKEMAKDLDIKAKDFDCYSSDDYLKIPQYYFNELGEKRYLDKIRSVLKLDLDIQPNAIHEMIFDLNPVHIITTNYDYLLEKQLEIIEVKNREYYKVANDKKLAFTSLSNYIIKMHGEFDKTSQKNDKKNNIVLKESDYDSYSDNFKLIETFVKGLFSTYTILFVGFSATDSNVRRLFQWIKDIVGNKKQPAYLIDVNDYKCIDKEFRIKHKYYEKQKIFPLYKCQVEREINDVLEYCKEKKYFKDKEGMNLYRFLYFIKNYESLDVNKYYKILKQLKGLKFINNDVLGKVFNSNNIEKRLFSGDYFPLESRQQRYEIDTFRLKTVLTYPKNSQERIKLLQGNSRLSKEEINTVNKLTIFLLYKGMSLSDENMKELDNVINSIQNYCSVSEEEIKKIKYINNIIERAKKYEQESFIDNFIKHEHIENESCKKIPNTVGVFEKAFRLYNERKYVESYNVLNEISNGNSQDPVIYFIAELNKKIIVENIKWEKSYMNDMERRIINESEKIDTERIIDQKIPNSIKPIVRIFLIENVENQYFKFIELLEYILDYKYLIKNGGFTIGNGYFKRLIKEVYSFFNFMLGNYSFVNRYRQTHVLWLQIVKAMFESYTITCEDTGNINLEPSIHKVKNFDYFVLYLIIEFTTNENIEKLLSRLKIKKLELQNKKKDIKTLIVSFSNYIDEISDIRLDGKDNISNDKTLNFLTIFRLIDIDNSADFKDIVYAYIKFVKFYVLHSINNQNIYIGFLGFIYVFKDKNINLEIYEDIISKMYNIVRESFVYDYLNLIIHCFEMLKKWKGYKFKIQEIIDFYLDKAKEDKTKCLDEVLIEMYSLVDQINREKIKNFFDQEKYKTITGDNWQTICFAVKNGVIEYFEDKQNFKRHLFNSIYKAIPQKKNDESNCELFIKLMNCLLCLIKEDEIKDKDIVKQLLLEIPAVKKFFPNNSESLKTLETLGRLIGICIDPESYDYSKVQLDDFKYLNTNIIEKIKKKFSSDGLKNIVSQMLEKGNFKENDPRLYDKFKGVFDGESGSWDEDRLDLGNSSLDEDSSNITSNTSGGTSSDSEDNTPTDDGSNSSDSLT